MIVTLPGAGVDKSVKQIQDIQLDLRSARVTSADSVNKRVMCTAKRHFGLQLYSNKGYRKLYFLTYEQMLAAADHLICTGQQFKSRKS